MIWLFATKLKIIIKFEFFKLFIRKHKCNCTLSKSKSKNYSFLQWLNNKLFTKLLRSKKAKMENILMCSDILYLVPQDHENSGSNQVDTIQTHYNMFTIPSKLVTEVNLTGV